VRPGGRGVRPDGTVFAQSRRRRPAKDPVWADTEQSLKRTNPADAPRSGRGGPPVDPVSVQLGFVRKRRVRFAEWGHDGWMRGILAGVAVILMMPCLIMCIGSLLGLNERDELKERPDEEECRGDPPAGPSAEEPFPPSF